MATVLVPGTRLTVFAIRRTPRGGSIWVRAGNGFVNKDASVNLWLDALPIDGQLHLRESVPERKESGLPPPPAVPFSVVNGEAAATEGPAPAQAAETEFQVAGGQP